MINKVRSESLLRLRPLPLTDVKGFGLLFRASDGKKPSDIKFAKQIKRETDLKSPCAKCTLDTVAYYLWHSTERNKSKKTFLTLQEICLIKVDPIPEVAHHVNIMGKSKI